MATTAQHHLQTVIDNWRHLTDMLDTHVSAPWPPAGRMSDYIDALDYADAQQVHQMRGGRDELDAGAGRAPLNLDALDAIRTTELALIGTADHLSTLVQRYPLSVDTGRGWTDDVHREAALIATRDQADPRRWSLTATATRTPPHAAVWLLHRLDDAPGPFRPLTSDQRRLIENVAREAGERVGRALVILRKSSRAAYPCPHCRKRALDVSGGDGQPASVACQACGRTWVETPAAVA